MERPNIEIIPGIIDGLCEADLIGIGLRGRLMNLVQYTLELEAQLGIEPPVREPSEIDKCESCKGKRDPMCSAHGVAASNARQDAYYRSVGGRD
jgi:hypothetical protein